MSDFLSGISDYFGAGRLITRTGLWKWLILPGLIGVFYWPGIAVLAWLFVDDTAAYLRVKWLPGFLQHGSIIWLVTVVLWAGFIYVGFIAYRSTIMIVYSPLLSIVSEKAEAGMGAVSAPADHPAVWWRGMQRGILVSLASLGLSVLAFVACWALLLIPIVGGLLFATLLPLSQLILAGHGFVDPTLERKGLRVGDSLRLLGCNKLRLLGCGCGFACLTMIPIVGWFLAPGWGMVAGTKTAIAVLSKRSGYPHLAPARPPRID
jgi:uncharacterized protein involved in cysteine biosynthesis